MCHLLKINTNLKKASDLGCRDQRLHFSKYLQNVGADTYISPPGSKGYLDETDLFELEGIQINYMNITILLPTKVQRFFAVHVNY